MQYCDACPIGPACLGPHHRRYCGLVKTDESYRRYLFERAGLDPSKPVDLDREPVAISARRKTTVTPPSTFRSVPTGRVRVGFLSPNLNAGGAESVQLQLLKGLDQNVFQIVGMVVKDPIGVTDASMTSQTSAYVPIQYGLDKIAALASQCDVLISWMIEDMTKWMGNAPRPYIYIDHFPHSAALDATSQKCLGGAAAVVGVSSLCSPAWTGDSWKSRYFVIPNSVDTSRLQVTQSRAQMLQKWGLPSNALVAGSYCRVHVDRRPDAVIKALPLLPDPWHAVLVGESNNQDELQYLQNMISQMPSAIQQRIHILPEDSNAGNVLSAFDVVVSCPSGVTESFGLTAAEALSLGKPVVATPFGLAQMHPEFFYPVLLDDTPINVATAILAAKLGGCKAGGQDFIRATYSPSNFVKAWSALLNGLTMKAMPAVPQLAGNFAKAVASHVADGFRKAPAEIREARMKTCRACPLLEPVQERCSHPDCGCWCSRKTAWLGQVCPMGKWEE